MRDFVDTAFRLRETASGYITQPAFDKTFDLVQARLPLLHSKSAIDLDNIETLFGLLEMGRVVGRLPFCQPTEIEDLALAMRRVLVETFEESTPLQLDVSRHAVPHETYGALAFELRRLRQERKVSSWAFITFNYDLCLDFALHWNNVPPDYGLASPISNGVPLLKLHGSLNWATCPKCGALRTLDFGQYFRDWSPPREPTNSVTLRPSRRLALLGSHCEGATAPSEPAIVPPSWNKTQYRGTFAKVWARAAAEIADAEEIIVAGYSLPPSDMFFRDLVAVAMAGPARVREFTVVNPDATVAGRIRELLGPAIRDRFRQNGSKFDDFIASRYPKAVPGFRKQRGTEAQ